MDKDLFWEILFVIVVIIVIVVSLSGCIGVDPASSMRDATINPSLTAEQISTAVVTAINSNASIVNDLWPIVAMMFIAVAGLVVGLVVIKKLNTSQTRAITEHTENCTHS